MLNYNIDMSVLTPLVPRGTELEIGDYYAHRIQNIFLVAMTNVSSNLERLACNSLQPCRLH